MSSFRESGGCGPEYTHWDPCDSVSPVCCLRRHGVGGEMAKAQHEKLSRDQCSVSTFVHHCYVSTLFCLYAILSGFQAASLQGSGDVAKFQPASVLPSLGSSSPLPLHPLQNHRSPEQANGKYQQHTGLVVLKAIKSKVEGWV